MNRREFCSSVVTAATLTTCSLAAAGASWRNDGDAPQPLRPHQLIFDERFAAARLLGAESAQRGMATTAFNGDVTALWFHDLGPRWTRDRAPVAGITTPQALLCLEQLAHDAWMRVRVRVEHAGGEAQPCGHRVTGQGANVARVCAALEAGAGWPARLAAALGEISPDDAARRVERRASTSGGPIAEGSNVRLVSWIIAA